MTLCAGQKAIVHEIAHLMVPRARAHLLSGSLHPVVVELSRRIGDSGALAVLSPRVGPIRECGRHNRPIMMPALL
jgi:hypothetical protein